MKKEEMQEQLMKLEKIAKYYGLAIQENKLIEELGELLVAISKDLASKTFKDCGNKISDEVIEEMADVLVLMAEIDLLTGCHNKVMAIFDAKINRQIERIDREKAEFAEIIEKKLKELEKELMNEIN